MIFSIGKHIQLIIKGIKTQTRRASDVYQVGKLYSIQPKRTSKAIPDGKILITKKRLERWSLHKITHEDAKQEGGYSPDQFEKLYEELHPKWLQRTAYTFRFVPTK